MRIVLRLTVVGGNLCAARLALLDEIRQHRALGTFGPACPRSYKSACYCGKATDGTRDESYTRRYTWLGSQRPTYFQAVDRAESGAREAAGEGTTALALPLAVAPARRVEPSRWYERVGGAPLPTTLAGAGAMVERLLLCWRVLHVG